jgi:hypothetical protein
MIPFFTKSEYLPDVVMDLDDLAQNPGNNCINFLMDLKIKYPKFKVTLFAIPYYQDKDNSQFFHMIKNAFGDWIDLAIHGWNHATPTECQHWTYDEAKDKIIRAYAMGCFSKVFKAPGWQISRDTYKVLDELGFIVADHTVSAYTEPGVLNSERRPASLKAYTVEHPWIIHGHTWNLNNSDPTANNGIEQLIEMGLPFDEKSNFHFIKDL